jgi:hypothetical protein
MAMGNSTTTTQGQVASAGRFIAEFPGTPIGRMAFSELGGINSKVTPSEYIFNDDRGVTQHTKQFGKTEPPTVTVKRAVDRAGTTALMLWHQMAREGNDQARQPGTLTVFDAGGNAQAVYMLEDAWLSEINISSVKAGAADVAMIECKITCQEIWSQK